MCEYCTENLSFRSQQRLGQEGWASYLKKLQSWFGAAVAGAGRGGRVALVLPSDLELVAYALGALRAGVIPVVLDPATPAEELQALLADADPGMVVDARFALPPEVGAPAPIPLGRPMHYTSGTTGRRKGVYSGILDPAAAQALWAEEMQLWGFGPDDVHVVVSPLYHSAPLRFAMGTVLAGGRVLAPGPFDARRFLDLCEHHRPTTMFTAPAQLQRLAELDDPRTTAALGRMRLIAHAGAPCPEPVRRWLIDIAGDAVHEFYGSTEGQFTTCSAAEWLAHPGTVGRARPGRTLSTDDGTIWCTVPEYARFSYWRDPAKTAAAWRGDAFTVGDLGRLDDGWLYLDGRRDDLIITGGVNVYPDEVERILSGCPGIGEVAVYGVDDERWGRRVQAAVTGRADEVQAWARAHLTPAQRPKAVHVVDELPRTSSGKVLRNTLARRP